MRAGFAVIVLNYNKRDDLLLCLKSLYDSSYPNIHIVVVDNNSADGSADAVAEAYPELPLIRNAENTGVAKGRNTGWQYAKQHFDFEYAIFLDDDAEVTPSYLADLAAIYKTHPAVGIATGKAYINLDSKLICSVGIAVNLYTGLIFDIGAGQIDRGQYDQSAYRRACGGFAFSARRDLLNELGAFDESFSPYGWEDVDFCLRAEKLGYKTYYTADAIVVHKGTKIGRKPIPAYERNKIRNYLLLLRRHTHFIHKICCCVFIPLKALKIIFEMIAKGQLKVILSQFQGFFEGLLKRSSAKTN